MGNSLGPGDPPPASGLFCDTSLTTQFPTHAAVFPRGSPPCSSLTEKLQYRLRGHFKWTPGFTKTGFWMRNVDSAETSDHSWSSGAFYLFLTLVLSKVVLIVLSQSLCLLHGAWKHATNWWKQGEKSTNSHVVSVCSGALLIESHFSLFLFCNDFPCPLILFFLVGPPLLNIHINSINK